MGLENFDAELYECDGRAVDGFGPRPTGRNPRIPEGTTHQMQTPTWGIGERSRCKNCQRTYADVWEEVGRP